MAAGAESSRVPAHPIGSVENALRLLVLFREQASISVSQASVQLGVARSTAHRLLAMLHAYDLVEQDPRTRAYRGGPMLVELGLAATRRDQAVAIMRPFLQRVVAIVDETAHLIALEGRNCRFVDSVECRQALRSTERVGVVYPAQATSGGKALLATLGQNELLELFPDERLAPLNARSLTSRTALLRELEQVRADGYATNFGQSEMGIAAVAVAQPTMSGATPVAVAISLPEQRLPDGRLPELVAVLRQITGEARRRLP